MNNFIIDTPDNFWQIRWLDKYMEERWETIMDIFSKRNITCNDAWRYKL